MKWLKITGLVVLISIIIGIVALITLPYRMTREIDSRIAVIKAQGDPVNGKDLIPHVPDSKNGAVIYEKVFKITEPGKDEIGKVSKMISSLDGAHDPGALASARRITSKYRSVIPIIEQASSRPQCRFKSNWSDPVEERLQPYLDKVRNVSQLLSVIAIVDAADGKMDDSVRTVGLSYKLSESLNDEPMLIGSVTRYKCISAASRSLKQSMQYGNISERQAHGLFDLLSKIDIRNSYRDAMKDERAFSLDLTERIRKNGFERKNGRFFVRETPDSRRRNPLQIWLTNSWLGADELFYLKQTELAFADANQPVHNWHSLRTKLDPKFPRYALLSTILLPVFSKAKLSHYESMTTLAGDRVFLAGHAYKSEFGSYPANLDDVEKKLGWKLPVDPMTGDRFRYRRHEKGFVLYGLGRNLKDDNAQTVEDLPESIRNVGPSDNRNTQFRDKYPYSTGTGRHSADMIWGKSR